MTVLRRRHKNLQLKHLFKDLKVMEIERQDFVNLVYNMREALHKIVLSEDRGQAVEQRKADLLSLLEKADDLIGPAWSDDEDKEEEKEKQKQEEAK